MVNQQCVYHIHSNCLNLLTLVSLTEPWWHPVSTDPDIPIFSTFLIPTHRSPPNMTRIFDRLGLGKQLESVTYKCERVDLLNGNHPTTLTFHPIPHLSLVYHRCNGRCDRRYDPHRRLSSRPSSRFCTRSGSHHVSPYYNLSLSPCPFWSQNFVFPALGISPYSSYFSSILVYFFLLPQHLNLFLILPHYLYPCLTLHLYGLFFAFCCASSFYLFPLSHSTVLSAFFSLYFTLCLVFLRFSFIPQFLPVCLSLHFQLKLKSNHTALRPHLSPPNRF